MKQEKITNKHAWIWEYLHSKTIVQQKGSNIGCNWIGEIKQNELESDGLFHVNRNVLLLILESDGFFHTSMHFFFLSVDYFLWIHVMGCFFRFYRCRFEYFFDYLLFTYLFFWYWIWVDSFNPASSNIYSQEIVSHLNWDSISAL